MADPQGHRPWGVRGDAGRPGTVRDVVELRLPADPAYLSVLRTATAGLAARLDFTLDEIEDLRIAVDEACAMLLPDVVDSGTLTCTFEMLEDALRITVAAPTMTATSPSEAPSPGPSSPRSRARSSQAPTPRARVTVRLHKRRGAAG